MECETEGDSRELRVEQVRRGRAGVQRGARWMKAPKTWAQRASERRAVALVWVGAGCVEMGCSGFGPKAELENQIWFEFFEKN